MCPAGPTRRGTLRGGGTGEMDRRQFLQMSGLSVAAAGTLAFGGLKATAGIRDLRIRQAKEVPTICPFCSVGCGMVAHVKDHQLINLEGDVENPISEGSLCPKGASAFQFAYNKNRVLKALYRAPKSDKWQEVPLDKAYGDIAQRIKATRDKTFKETQTVGDKQITVNRTDGIAHIGSACIDNEENYLITKAMRGLGVVYLEHHARI